MRQKNCTLIIFADRNLSTVITMINKELKLITEWFRVNKLSINVNKTNFILFISPRKNYSSHTVVDKILINDIPIKQVHSVKFLGVYLDEHLQCSGVTMFMQLLVKLAKHVEF